MNKIQEQIISHVQMDIEPGEVVTEELLTELVRFYSCRHPLSESEFKEVVVDLQSKLAVRMDPVPMSKKKIISPGIMRQRVRLIRSSGQDIVHIFIKMQGLILMLSTQSMQKQMK